MTEAAFRAGDQETSIAAAASISGTVAERLRQMALNALSSAAPGGLTVPEIAAASDVKVISISPRIAPLVRDGLVVDSGEKRIPPGGTRKCIVWRLAACGRELIRTGTHLGSVEC